MLLPSTPIRTSANLRNILTLLVTLTSLSACQDRTAVDPLTAPAENARRELSNVGEASARYIVTFKDNVGNVPEMARSLTSTHGGELRFTYTHVLRGFAAALPPEAMAAIQHNPNVSSVIEDEKVTTSGTQSSATWGLDRIDQRGLPLSGTYGYTGTGTGVNAYIIDTGIRYTHAEFTDSATYVSRAVFGYDAVGPDQYGYPKTPGEDCNGHGTHVSGIVGGKTYGVAKNVNLISVRVLDCVGSGTMSGVIAGMDWVAANHVGPSVANMSLAGGINSPLNQAAANLVASGVTVVVAAANNNTDACLYSPASAPSAITVGATDATDTRASFSNYGSCVDLFAPGVGIVSAYASHDLETQALSGTSMASPHVAGVAALFLETHPSATPPVVTDSILAWSTKAIVKNSNSANNHLLYSLAGVYSAPLAPTPPANQPPVASFTASCSALSCNFTDQSTDADGTIVSRVWTFGDGGTSTAKSPIWAYGGAGAYVVTLKITDDVGATSSTSLTVNVTAPVISPIALNAQGKKVKNSRVVDLYWTGATTSMVDVIRNGTRITSVSNTGYYSETVSQKTAGNSLTYAICQASQGLCSPERTITF